MNSVLLQPAQRTHAENYLALSREFQDQQLYKKAEETLLVALEKLPGNPFLLRQLSSLYLKLDMTEQALAMVNQLIRAHPKLSFPYYLRGKIFEKCNQPKQALREYERALSGGGKDSYVLTRFIPLLIQEGLANAALGQIRHYQQLLKRPTLFAELQAEALLKLGRRSEAFNKMRDALQVSSSDRRLLKRYLQFSIQNGQRPPGDVYEILKMSLPGQVEIDQEDLLDVQVDFHVHQQTYVEALRLIHEGIGKNPNYYWRKRIALIILEMGRLDQSLSMLKELFRQDPSDVDVRALLEKYYLMAGKIDSWKNLIQNVLREQSLQVELFQYLRSLDKKRDWLSVCQLNYQQFMSQVEDLNMVRSDISDLTFRMLPSYTLEIFLTFMAIHNKILNPDRLFRMIYSERQRKNQVPPFNLEDLEAAYPVWIFALHIYFSFKEHLDSPVAFIPKLLLNENVAVLIDVDGLEVRLDLSLFLDATKTQLKPVTGSGKSLSWRVPVTPEPDLMLHEVKFFTREQFGRLVESFGSILTENKKNGALDLQIS